MSGDTSNFNLSRLVIEELREFSRNRPAPLRWARGIVCQPQIEQVPAGNVGYSSTLQAAGQPPG